MQTFTRESAFNKLSVLALLLALVSVPTLAEAGWKVKFDREARDMRGQKTRPFGVEAEILEPQPPALKTVKALQPAPPTIQDPLPALLPEQELSLIMTDEGFSPHKLHLKKGESYKITVVNVSHSHRNSSFVIPSLSVYEGVYFADPTTIEVTAGAEGLYQFLSPESGVRGDLVVYESPTPSPTEVKPPEEEPLSPPQVLPLRLPTSVGRD